MSKQITEAPMAGCKSKGYQAGGMVENDMMSKRLDQKGRTPSMKKTRKMPSGAQQYVRGKTTGDRLDTLTGLGGFERSSKMPFGPERRKMFDMEMGRSDAFIDELEADRVDRAKSRERVKKFRGGGKVTGYKKGGAVMAGRKPKQCKMV